jgi:hypothetical protein
VNPLAQRRFIDHENDHPGRAIAPPIEPPLSVAPGTGLEAQALKESIRASVTTALPLCIECPEAEHHVTIRGGGVGKVVSGPSACSLRSPQPRAALGLICEL